MGELIAIHSDYADSSWLRWVKSALENISPSITFYRATAAQMLRREELCHKRVLFICDLNEIGRDHLIDNLLLAWKKKLGSETLKETYCGVVSRSHSDWFTKTYARYLTLQLNAMGATIIGKPLVELLPGFENLMTWQKKVHLPLETLAQNRIADLAERLASVSYPKMVRPNILVLHASKENESNTLALWRLVEAELKAKESSVNIREIYIERGSITDCIGCSFEVCIEEAKNLSCVVGGQFVSQIMPALDWADAVVWLCPNYNDTISADLMSVINRMSGFYRYYDLSQKRIYGIIVSGNSGTDAVAHQLVGSLNVNKGFVLPPKFCLTEIASGPLSVLEKEGIRDKISKFSDLITTELCE